MSSAVVYTPLLAQLNKRQYPVTTDQLNSLLAGASVVTFSSLTQALAPYLLISSLPGSLAPYVTAASLAATLATFPALSTTNIWTGKQEFKDLPWADITAWGAVRGQDSTTAIQAAVDHMNGVYGGGFVFVPPGTWVTGSAGITIKGGVILLGSGAGVSYINGTGQDATVITFDGSCNFAGLRDALVGGFLTTAATQNAVVVSNGVPMTMRDTLIVGGQYALDVRGAGRFYNVSPQGYVGCVISSGSSWFTDCAFDGPNIPLLYAYNRVAPGAAGGFEDQIVDCDFSGNYRNSIHIDDGTLHQVRTKILGGIISSPIAVVNHGWTLLSGCELGSSVYSLTPTNPITITGCYQQASGTVTLAGANVIKSANYQIA
jgi:hypothetical protein